MFAVPDVQLRFEICGEFPKVTLVGVRVQARPTGVEADTESITEPVSPLVEVIVTLEVPVAPARI